ncbi:unnamed protein product [Penicillium salamii]|uniref:EKC/KEOPS complex subunit BUD32 n=1 Tax=Penicillium salamii TaxID=1612424 RepID=A0A9W4JS64_9EURO|nr:unnamed protein product [Penicillium salamii]
MKNTSLLQGLQNALEGKPPTGCELVKYTSLASTISILLSFHFSFCLDSLSDDVVFLLYRFLILILPLYSCFSSSNHLSADNSSTTSRLRPISTAPINQSSQRSQRKRTVPPHTSPELFLLTDATSPNINCSLARRAKQYDQMDHRYFLLDDTGRQPNLSVIINVGNHAVILRRANTVRKMAIVHTYDSPAIILTNRAHIRQEQTIYRLLQPNINMPCPGIVPCTGLWGNTIELQYMSQGTLENMLKHMADCLSNIHAHHILHNDIALRNILLDGSWNIMITDFGASTIIPPAKGMNDYMDDYHCSIWTDLIQLGSVFYAILTGERSPVTIYPENGSYAEYPPRESLPDVTDLWAGGIIEDCWNPRAVIDGGAWEVARRVRNLTS